MVTASNGVDGEVTGLDQCIAYAQHLADQAGTHGPDGNEGYLARLVAARVIGAGLSTGRDMQDAFAAAAAAAAAHTDQLTQQKTVQEAYDMTDGAGDKDFQRGEQASVERHRFDILADSAGWGGRTSLTEQTAAARRNLLEQLQQLTEVLAAGGAAEEGITAVELAQIRSAALRLAAAADTATDHLGGTR